MSSELELATERHLASAEATASLMESLLAVSGFSPATVAAFITLEEINLFQEDLKAKGALHLFAVQQAMCARLAAFAKR